MVSIQKNQNLFDLVAGKRVAIVGPAPYLVDKELGSLLDDYDVICRPNDIIPPIDRRKDYASRTDIMFHGCGTPQLDVLKNKVSLALEHFKKLKLVVCPVILSEHSEMYFYLSWPDDYVSNVVRNFYELNKYDIPFYWIGVKDYKTLYGIVGQQPNVGVLAIIMLLCYPIEELFVSGYTFYLGGDKFEDQYYNKHYFDKLYQPPEKKYDVNGGHGYDANMTQIMFFKSLCEQQGNRIRVDSYLNDLLQLNHSNVVGLEY